MAAVRLLFAACLAAAVAAPAAPAGGAGDAEEAGLLQIGRGADLRQAAGQDPCSAFGPQLLDEDISGTAIAGPDTWDVHVSSYQGCCLKCGQLASCQGFTYWQAGSKCYLKSNVTGSFLNDGRVSYMKSAASPAGKCHAFSPPLVNQDIGGSPIHGSGTWDVWVSDVEECCSKCGQTASCQGFAFWEAGSKCYLKSNVTGAHPNSGRTSYVKSAALTTPAPLPASTPAPLPASTHAPDPASVPCGGVFVSDEGVRYTDSGPWHFGAVWVFGAYENGYFKMVSVDRSGRNIETRYSKGYSTYEAQRMRIWDSARRGGAYTAQVTKFCAPDPCSDFRPRLADQDLEGSPIHGRATWDVKVSSVRECCATCGRMDDCQGFVFWTAGSKCYMKTGRVSPHPKAGRVAFVKPVSED